MYAARLQAGLYQLCLKTHDNLLGLQHNLQCIAENLDALRTHQKAAEAMQMGSEALDKAVSAIKVQDVERLMDRVSEQIHSAMDTSQALSEPLAGALTDEELFAMFADEEEQVDAPLAAEEKPVQAFALPAKIPEAVLE